MLYTIRDVDYEMASEYTLQVTAADGSALSPRSSIINIRIKVEDVNDCAPTFDQDPIIFSVPESTREGALVWNFSAKDLDSGANGQVSVLCNFLQLLSYKISGYLKCCIYP